MIVNFNKTFLAQSIAEGINDTLFQSFYYTYGSATYNFNNGYSEILYPPYDIVASASFNFDSVFINFHVIDTSRFSITDYPIELTRIGIEDGNGELLLDVQFDANEFVINNSSELNKLLHITIQVRINV